MTCAELRRRFLDFFAQRGHAIVPSSPLVPANDPTLLFVNAGMVQFKDVFLGNETRDCPRVVTSQRCVRAGGKHNDLENVGYTARHHTFFEMLGNFSFGDYFKREAIRYAWEFLTEELGLPAEKLWVTVYRDDDEAADIWLKEIGVPASRFARLGEKDNFWAMGDTGPCGPCSEIFYDHGPATAGGPPGSADEDGDRYIEIWNLVFMQYERKADGSLVALPRPSVDTGAGLERLAAVMQGVHSNYDIDLFQHLLRDAARLLGTDDVNAASLKVIADHIRSCAFLVVDGVLPANEGRGYVLRRIVRRAVRHGYRLGVHEAFFHKLVPSLVAVMGDAFPELREKQGEVERALREEERQFARTLANGMGLLETEIARLEEGDAALAQAGAVGQRGGGEPGAGRSRAGQPDAGQLGGGERDAEPQGRGQQEVGSQDAGQRGSGPGSTGQRGSGQQEAGPEGLGQEGLGHEGLGQSATRGVIPGHVVFKLYDTYGFPVDLTADVAREHGLAVDRDGFEVEMTRQRERARAAGQFAASTRLNLEPTMATDFTGYGSTEGEAVVLALFALDGERLDAVTAAAAASAGPGSGSGAAGGGEAKGRAGFGSGAADGGEAAVSTGSDSGTAKGSKTQGRAASGSKERGDRSDCDGQDNRGNRGEGGGNDEAQGQAVLVLLDASPFYGESGGQVGDVGILENDGLRFAVDDTQKQGAALLHRGRLLAGGLRVGERLRARVAAPERQAITRHHSATHLLHAGLRQVLGTHVAQKGSLVDAERLRFDFSHPAPLTAEELQAVEAVVNEQVLLNTEVTKEVMPLEEAKRRGALALFGEKYGAEVRVVAMGGSYSVEFCGGTHVERTGDIGLVKILSETGISAGVRRLEAVSGPAALAVVTAGERVLREVCGLLRATPENLSERAAALVAGNRQLEKDLRDARAKLAAGTGADLSAGAEDLGHCKLLTAVVGELAPNDLRALVDRLKAKLDPAVIVLASPARGKVSLVVGVSKTLTERVQAGELMEAVAGQLGGRGGGKPELAMGGAPRVDDVPAALASVRPWVERQFSSQ